MAKVTLYEHKGFDGDTLALTEAETNLHDRDFGDKVSSIRTAGGSGRWVFYEHTFFRGRSFSLNEGASRSWVGDDWNDIISSVVYQPSVSTAEEEEESGPDVGQVVAEAEAAAMWQPDTTDPMTMQKVRILREDNGIWRTVVDCAAQFNPSKLKLSKKAAWKTEKTWQSNIGKSTFTGGKPIRLSAKLFFDTTASGGDVRRYTEPLMALTMVDLAEAAQGASEEEVKEEVEAKKEELQQVEETISELESSIEESDDSDVMREALQPLIDSHEQNKAALEREVEDLENQLKGRAAGSKGAPPKCKFVWGNFSFIAIMESVKVTFNMFLPNGTPIRAQAKVKMKQIEEQALYEPQNPTTRSAPRKTWTVKAGQTLDWIAYQEYGDPSLWRRLARLNDLDNPLDLVPGQVLKL
jgi:nucleoid-associated protein YgaU